MTVFFDLEGFKRYLDADGKRNTKQILQKAKKYGYILQTKDASELMTFSNTKRRHTMEALVCLSKYLGIYPTWKEIKEKYQLKWSSPDSLEVFQVLFNNEHNFTAMLGWLKETVAQIPTPYASILIFGVLTGLRPSEACQSISLIQNDLDNYLKKDKMILEHYRYPQTYIRRSKKAFISLVDDQILQIAKESTNCGYDALRNYLKRRKLDMNMGYCRKIFATFLRQNGIEAEIIDLLQGRVPKSVFVRHYFRPDLDFNKVRQCVTKLYNEVTSGGVI